MKYDSKIYAPCYQTFYLITCLYTVLLLNILIRAKLLPYITRWTHCFCVMMITAQCRHRFLPQLFNRSRHHATILVLPFAVPHIILDLRHIVHGVFSHLHFHPGCPSICYALLGFPRTSGYWDVSIWCRTPVCLP